MNKQIKPQTNRGSRGAAFLLLGSLLVAGCRAPGNGQKGEFSNPPTGLFPEATNAATGSSGPSGFVAVVETGNRFAIGDQVTVKFSGTTDENLKTHEERIKEDGNITLPYIKDVKAAGRTAGELQKDITDLYVPDYYLRLTVTVTGEQRVYFVGGRVKLPGRSVYIGATTVTKAIQSAGDFDDFAAKRRVKLTRADGKTTLTVDCKKAAEDPAFDPQVYPGDKIEVPMRGILDTFD